MNLQWQLFYHLSHTLIKNKPKHLIWFQPHYKDFFIYLFIFYVGAHKQARGLLMGSNINQGGPLS